MYFILLCPKQLKAMATTKSSQEPWVTFARLAVAVVKPLEAAVKPLLCPDQLLNKQQRIREQLQAGSLIRQAVAEFDKSCEQRKREIFLATVTILW